MDAVAPEQTVNTVDDGVYLVPYKWWREAQESHTEGGVLYSVCPAPASCGGPMRIFGGLFNSSLFFCLQREEGSKRGDVELVVPGRSYALISRDMWSHSRNGHKDSVAGTKGIGNSLHDEDYTFDVYPLMIRISYMEEASTMIVNINKKENAVVNFKKACKTFNMDTKEVHIWDYLGKKSLAYMNQCNGLSRDSQCQSDKAIRVRLQVYAFPESLTCRSEGYKNNFTVLQSMMASLSCGGLLCSDGIFGDMDSDFHLRSRSVGNGSLGLNGLENLGNTCFMNSAVQCLTHTSRMVQYFLGDYSGEINQNNSLGMNGELALAFGELLRKLWAPERTPVNPSFFKAKLAHFAPRFSGFNQHDSHELLSFLLDGLHEDLNRVKCKPYIEAKDSSGCSDEEIADEYWGNHLAQNDSVIVDVYQGQYRSTLVCPACNKVSVMFDPFMYLSLPLPSTVMRTMTVMVFSTDGITRPSPYTVDVPKSGKCKDFIQALSVACSLKDDENLLITEVTSNCIARYLEEPSDSLSLIRDGDQFAAYRLPKDLEKLPLVVFMQRRMEQHYFFGKITSRWKAFGVPLVARVPSTTNGSTIHELFLKLLNPFLQSKDCEDISPLNGKGRHIINKLQFYLADEKGQSMHSKIEMDEPVWMTASQRILHVLVCWQDQAICKNDMCLLNSLPEIYKFRLFPRRSQASLSLHACLETFLKEEPLGPEDMWYCPCCKKHQQAIKKLDLWRLPEILIIHLKRFSYDRLMRNKLETYVDFPIHHLDLSTYVGHKTKQSANCYRLYAISNHYGNMGGGHYTAYVYHEGENHWYDFDDRHVVPIPEDSIKTSAAYVLYYRRI